MSRKRLSRLVGVAAMAIGSLGVAMVGVGRVNPGVRFAVGIAPPLIGLQGWLASSTPGALVAMYGNVTRSSTRNAIGISLIIAVACLYAWMISGWINNEDYPLWPAYAVPISLIAATAWCLILELGWSLAAQASLLVVESLALIAAAYNGGDPITWLLWPAFHALAFDAGAWVVGAIELKPENQKIS